MYKELNLDINQEYINYALTMRTLRWIQIFLSPRTFWQHEKIHFFFGGDMKKYCRFYLWVHPTHSVCSPWLITNSQANRIATLAIFSVKKHTALELHDPMKMKAPKPSPNSKLNIEWHCYSMKQWHIWLILPNRQFYICIEKVRS
jgi:hypothetical protein